MIVTEPLIICDVPNINNIIYSFSAITKMVSNIDLSRHKVYVYSRPPLDNEDLAPMLRDTCGQVKEFIINNESKILFTKMEIFDSSINPITIKYKNNKPCFFTPVGFSRKNKLGNFYVYYEYEIDSVNLVNNNPWLR